MVDYGRKISDILFDKAEIFLSLPANEPLNTVNPIACYSDDTTSNCSKWKFTSSDLYLLSTKNLRAQFPELCARQQHSKNFSVRQSLSSAFNLLGHRKANEGDSTLLEKFIGQPHTSWREVYRSNTNNHLMNMSIISWWICPLICSVKKATKPEKCLLNT